MDYSFINISGYFKLNTVTFILMGLKLKASFVETSDFLLITFTRVLGLLPGPRNCHYKFYNNQYYSVGC